MAGFFYVIFGKIIAIIVGALYWRYLSRPYRIVLLLVVLALIFETIGYYLGHFKQQQNVWLFNLYMPLEPLLLGVASLEFIKMKKYKPIVYGLLLLNFIVWLLEILHNSIYNFASFSMICGCFLLTGLYIGVLLNNTIYGKRALVSEPSFWLCLSVILYFGCDIPYMGMFKYWGVHKLALIRLANINSLLDLIRYPLVAISFFILGYQQRLEEIKNTSG